MTTITNKDASKLEEILKTIKYGQYFFTVSAPVIRHSIGGKSSIGISLHPQASAGSPAFTLEGLIEMRAYLQKEFAKHPGLAAYKFISVDWIDIIMTQELVIRKWQLVAEVKGGNAILEELIRDVDKFDLSTARDQNVID